MDSYVVKSRKLEWTTEYQVYVNEFYLCTFIECNGKYVLLHQCGISKDRPEGAGVFLRTWIHLKEIK